MNQARKTIIILGLSLFPASVSWANPYPADQKAWPAYAQSEIGDLGIPMIPGGVHVGVVRNQKQGEDCWSFSIGEMYEAFTRKAFSEGKLTFRNLKLAPEYLLFWHIYQQIQDHIPDFQKLADTMKAHPNDPKFQKIFDKLKHNYGKGIRRKHWRSSPDQSGAEKELELDLFEPDVGNEAAKALQEVARFGVLPYNRFVVEIRQSDQEADFEKQVGSVVGRLIMDEIHNKIPLKDYLEKNAGQDINLKLFELLQMRLEPIYNEALQKGQKYAPIPLPTTTWSYANQTYSALAMIEKFKSLGFDLVGSYTPVISSKETAQSMMDAIAIGLLKTKLPEPIGISIYKDVVVNDHVQTNQDFAEATGLFTNSICKKGCQSEDGSHEVKAVNFIGRLKSGNLIPANLSDEDKITMIQSGQLKVTALIIQNSWGPGGVDINGAKPSSIGKSGYYVITGGYLQDSTSEAIQDPFDALLPNDVVKMYPSFQIESADNDERKIVKKRL